MELTGDERKTNRLIAESGPLLVSFDALVDVDGWTIDLRSESSSSLFDNPALPPQQRAVNALLVAVDYAVRRGANSSTEVVAVVKRESPVCVIGAETLGLSLAPLLERMEIQSESPRAFARRSRGHSLAAPVRSDPALSFEERSMDKNIGDNALSSLAVYAGGRVDQFIVSGEIGERWAVEVGLPDNYPDDALDPITSEIARMPAFMQGITSYLDDDGIVVGWRASLQPDPKHIGSVIHAWTKALFDLSLVDLRIVFAPASGEFPELAKMRERARSLHRDRTAGLAKLSHLHHADSNHLSDNGEPL
jgi:hypothetical protein